MSLKTPILFLVFNRPDTTKIVFEEIRKQKPQKLFIAADGPRENNLEDLEKCNKVKEIFKDIDWPCEVNTLFRANNLGCKIAVSQGINWFFENVEEGIILEDDILPDSSFFPFCKNMLELYREEANVMHISGFNVMGKWKSEKQDFHLSYFGSIWGWATWRRAWKSYDISIKKWEDKAIQKYILHSFFPRKLRLERKKLYDDLYNGKINTWDYQWTFARLINNGLSLIPSKNLIKNIGFNKNATHTFSIPKWFINKSFELHLGDALEKSYKVDYKYDKIHLLRSSNCNSYENNLFRKFIFKLKNILRKIFK